MELTESVASQVETSAAEKQQAIEANHEKIRELTGKGNLTEALSVCDAALALDPSNADSLFLKALVLYRLGDHRKAEPLLIEAFAINAFSIEYYTLLSGIYLHKGELEEANLVADQGLAFHAGHLATLQVKALALIRLFRLQEAHGVMQKMQRIRQESVPAQEACAIAEDDPEVLMEQALTIDPFKTKSRLESLDAIKTQTGIFRLTRGVMFAERNNTIIGLGILAGLIMAIAFFFRDHATYKAFTVLIVSLLLAVTGQKNALSASTNMPLFFPKAFRKFLQKKDVSMAVRAMIAMILMIAACCVWHYMKSFIALFVAFSATAYFVLLQEKFPSGTSLNAFTIPKPRRKKQEEAQMSITTVPLEQVSYDMLYRAMRRYFPGKDLVATIATGRSLLYGFLFVLIYPLVFLTMKMSGIDLSYKVLVIPEFIALFVLQFPFMMGTIANLPVFFPAGARRFIPGSARRNAYLRLLLALLLAGSFVAWLVLDNAHVLWASGLLMFLMVRSIFSIGKKKEAATVADERTPSKEELIAYIRQHHEVLKRVEVTQPLTAVSAEGSGEQR
jgi:tetratricopeptide (TPR) repeat protein